MSAKLKAEKLAAAVQETAALPLDQGLLHSLVGYNCRRAYLAIMPLFAARMDKYELRAVDFSVLTLIKSNPNLTQRRLAEAVNVSPPNMATLLDRLEQRELLVRQRNPLDKRSQTLVLTTEGARLCTKAEKTVSELELDATGMLSDAERAQLLLLLQKIYQ
ncbi:MAG: MarR family transcriptional regulator [Pseudomonadota bacterium]